MLNYLAYLHMNLDLDGHCVYYLPISAQSSKSDLVKRGLAAMASYYCPVYPGHAPFNGVLDLATARDMTLQVQVYFYHHVRGLHIIISYS